jgi:4-hydroxy-tetrahydrodipicolinate reductase
MGSAARALLASQADIALLACVTRVAAADPEPAGPAGCAWIDAPSFGVKTLGSLPADTVVLDVSLAAGSEALLSVLEREPRAAVVATTGLPDAVESRWTALSARVPIVRARNLSLGAAVARGWFRSLGPVVRSAFVADVVEQHHAGKRDAPSGTAVELASALGTMGSTERPGGVVHTHAIRAGTVPGTHRVILSGAGETLEVIHTVHDRDVFAAGALRAVRFLHGRAPGLYTVDDLIESSATPRKDP